MKLPRNINGEELSKRLGVFGYKETRQRGSHIRLTTKENGEHNITIPNHFPVRVGTLSSIIKDVADHIDMSIEEVKEKLFGDG